MLAWDSVGYFVDGVRTYPWIPWNLDAVSAQVDENGSYVTLTVKNESTWDFEGLSAYGSGGLTINGLPEDGVLFKDMYWLLRPNETYDIYVYFDPARTYDDYSHTFVQVWLNSALEGAEVKFQYVPDYPVTLTDLTTQQQSVSPDPFGIDSCSCDDISITQEAKIVLTFEAKVDAAIDFSDSVMLTVDIGGITSSQTRTLSSTREATEPAIQRFTFSFDASLFDDLDTVDYTATLSEVLPDPAPSHEMIEPPPPIRGEVQVPKNDVTISSQPRLRFGDNGALFAYGSGAGSLFADDGVGGFLDAPGTFSTLAEITGGYELTDRDGTTIVFDTGGYALTKTDSKGRTTTYSYITYGDEKLLTEISDPFLTTTFTYTGDKLIEASTSKGGFVSLAYTGDLLTSVTRRDPDGPGGLPAAQTTYSYDTNDRLISKTVDGLTTNYTYDSTGRLASVQDPTGSTMTYVSPQQSAVTNGNPQETITDQRGLSTKYERDFMGNVTRAVDAGGNVSLYERDDNGLLLKATLPDSDGNGPLEAAVYEYTYDSRGNLLTETAPDASVRTFVYHPVWNQPIQYTDGNGNVTLYSYDNTHELLLSETIVVGEVDDGINMETDDIVTTFTYTPAPVLPGDPPAGLIASFTDPHGVTTAYEHDSLGQVTQTTYAVGTADESTTSTTYCLCGGVSSFTDELGNTTTYQRDALFRVTSITTPDPDGAGPLTASVTQYTYNAMGLVATETVNGRVTSYS